MNKHLIPGRKPHGRLDDGYAVSHLRRALPLYEFPRDHDDRDDAKQRKRLDAAERYESARRRYSARRRVVPSDWDRPSGGFNNSAAGVPVLRKQPLTPPPQQQPSQKEVELLKQRLRRAFGDSLLRRGDRYVAPERIGPVLDPPAGGSSGNRRSGRQSGDFQSVRGRVVGPVPPGVFDSRATDDGSPSGSPFVPFEWCDDENNENNGNNGNNRNNGNNGNNWNNGNNRSAGNKWSCWSNGNNKNGGCAVVKRVSYRTAKRTATRSNIANWIFLYFRVRKISWEFVVHEERCNSSSVNLFSDSVIDNWTDKLRFRVLREAPMKYAMLAFLSRMGLDTEPGIVFTTDGFYGDLQVGSPLNRNLVPHKQVSGNTTALALGLQNGDSIFVARVTARLRTNVEMQRTSFRDSDGSIAVQVDSILGSVDDSTHSWAFDNE